MKIAQVELYEVEIPPIPVVARYLPKIYDITLCRVLTDEGLEGWGEFIDKKSVGQEQADTLVGQDPPLSSFCSSAGSYWPRHQLEGGICLPCGSCSSLICAPNSAASSPPIKCSIASAGSCTWSSGRPR